MRGAWDSLREEVAQLVAADRELDRAVASEAHPDRIKLLIAKRAKWENRVSCLAAFYVGANALQDRRTIRYRVRLHAVIGAALIVLAALAAWMVIA